MHEIFQQALKDFKFDTSKYINLPPLGIRNAVIEECAQAFEKAAAEAGRQECCGHYRGGDRFDDPPECCGDPDYIISNVAGAAAIRALKSPS